MPLVQIACVMPFAICYLVTACSSHFSSFQFTNHQTLSLTRPMVPPCPAYCTSRTDCRYSHIKGWLCWWIYTV